MLEPAARGALSYAGAAGGIGQPLALILKGSSLIGELSLYDIVGTEGVAADLSHIDSSVKVMTYPAFIYHQKVILAVDGYTVSGLRVQN